MENKVKVWLARNKNGYIFVHFERPYKNTEEGLGEWISYAPNVYDKEFPSIKWEDNEPTEAYITLVEPQPKQEKAIDWEQRRYEIAKDLYVRWRDMDAKWAVHATGLLINELKKQSK